tara:strand:+ start:72 stop:803 length:732 start_codon:yes stop_codon:yes gene_type:complete
MTANNTKQKPNRVEDLLNAAASTAQERSIPKTPLSVGQGIYIYKVNNSENQASSVLLGFDHGKFLMFHRPILKGIPLSLAPGDRFIIKFVSKGQLVGFRSRLLGSYGTVIENTPLNVFFSSFPDEIESLDIRSVERKDVFIPARIQFREQQECKAIVLDLSRRGARILFNPPFPIKKNSKLKCSIMLPTNRNIIGQQISVKRVFRLPDGKVEIGVTFDFSEDNKSRESEHAIVQYLSLADFEK